MGVLRCLVLSNNRFQPLGFRILSLVHVLMAAGKIDLDYLSRYTNRVAISNRRLIAFDDRGVTFRYKD